MHADDRKGGMKMSMRYNVLSAGLHDAVLDGDLIQDIPSKTIYVNGVEERDSLPDIMPGTFVATYGLETIWQYKGGGEWATVSSDESE